MPLKDPEARRIWVNDYTRRRRSDPIKKARQDEMRRARYPKIKDLLNAKRRAKALERSMSKPKVPRSLSVMAEESRIKAIQAKQTAKAVIVRAALMRLIPKDGTVHRVTDIRRAVGTTIPVMAEAMQGTDIDMLVSGKTRYLYRMP